MNYKAVRKNTTLTDFSNMHPAAHAQKVRDHKKCAAWGDIPSGDIPSGDRVTPKQINHLRTTTTSRQTED
jgi:hypothetical protein